MAADVDIANSALALLGIPGIAALTDSAPKAIACNRKYPLSLAAELRAHRWSFAMTRVVLPQDATAPTFGFSYAFTLPADLVRVDYVGNHFAGGSMTDYRTASEADYQIEGRKILTGAGSQSGSLVQLSSTGSASLNLRYVRLTTDTGSFDPLFVEALACRLARDLVTLLTESNVKAQTLMAMYRERIDEAVRVNAIEKSPEPLPDDSWMLSRL